MKVYVRSVFHLRKLKKSMLPDWKAVCNESISMLAVFFPGGLCQVYVSTSLLGPTKRAAFILALKQIWMNCRTRTGHGSDHLSKLEDAMKMAWNKHAHTHNSGRRVVENKQTHKQTNKRTYIHTHIHTYTHTHIHTYTHTHIHTYIHTYKKEKQTNKQTSKQANKQTNKQTSKLKH